MTVLGFQVRADLDGMPLALLALALAGSLAAAVRVVRREGIAVGVAAAAIPSGTFLFGALVDLPWFLKWFSLVCATAAVCKVLSLGRRKWGTMGIGRALLYLALYPGLDPDRSFRRDSAARRGAGAVQALFGLLECGACLALARLSADLGLLDAGTYPSAWARAAVFTLYMDGSFRAVMGVFRAAGAYGEDVFRDPWLLSDLADFWGRRWNRFVGRTLALEALRPLQPRIGRSLAVLATFLSSGVMHEVLFVVPTGAAAGDYVLFFLVQGAAMLLIAWALPGPGRSAAGRFARRAAAWATLLVTAPLFFGEPYRRALPFERAIGRAGDTASAGAAPQALGFGGASARASHFETKPTRLCEPSQNGLFAD
jgi:hypothetical protein